MFNKIIPSAEYLSIDALGITITGALQTGIFLNFSETVTGDYRDIQKEVEKKLSTEYTRLKWTIPASGEEQKYEVDALGTGKSHRPSYYIKCSVNNCKKTIKYQDKYKFVINKIKIKFYEFGFATLSLSIKIVATRPKDKNKMQILPGELLSSINELDKKIVERKVEQINDLIDKIVEKYKNAVDNENILKFDIKTTDQIEQKPKIISFHRIFEYGVDKNFRVRIAKRNFDKIAQLSGGIWEIDDCFSHFVGVANSVIVFNSSGICDHSRICTKILERYQKAYKTVLETANAYYFIAEGITNRLADYSRRELASENKKKEEKFIKKLFCKICSIIKFSGKEKFKQFNQYILLISNFSSVYNEFEVNLNRQGKSVWSSMEKVWTVSKTVDILKNQLNNSSLMFDRIIKYNKQKFQWILNWIATIFTAIGAISLVEIAQSKGLKWEFDWHTILPNSLDEFVSKFINFIGSALAVALIVTLLCIIYYGVKAFLRWVFGRKKNENSAKE